MLEREDVDRITDGLENLPEDLHVTFHSSERMPVFSKTLLDFAYGIARVKGSGTEPLWGNGEDLFCTPAVSFHRSDWGDIHYMALPSGKEAAPFREMLSGISPLAHHLSDELKEQLRGFPHPTDIAVFITTTCPHCPQAVRAAIALALICRQISVSVIDGEMFTELAKNYHIQSVPMIIINRELMINRVLSPLELAEAVLLTHTAHHRRRTFLSYIETGNIDKAVNQLLSDPLTNEYFLSAWEKSSLHLRMGLLFAAERVLAQRPKLLNPIISGLIEILHTEDISLRGDTADLLGRIGDPLAEDPISALLSDTNPDVAEIAKEALENINTASKR